MSLNCCLSVQYYSLLSTHLNIISLDICIIAEVLCFELCTQYPTPMNFRRCDCVRNSFVLYEFLNKKQQRVSLTLSSFSHILFLFSFRLLRLLIYSNEPMNSNDNLMTIKKRFVHTDASSICVHLYMLYCVLMILLTSKVTRLVNQTSNKQLELCSVVLI